MDTSKHMGVTALNWNNASLNTRATKVARSSVVELIGRPHFDAFQLAVLE